MWYKPLTWEDDLKSNFFTDDEDFFVKCIDTKVIMEQNVIVSMSFLSDTLNNILGSIVHVYLRNNWHFFNSEQKSK